MLRSVGGVCGLGLDIGWFSSFMMFEAFLAFMQILISDVLTIFSQAFLPSSSLRQQQRILCFVGEQSIC